MPGEPCERLEETQSRMVSSAIVLEWRNWQTQQTQETFPTASNPNAFIATTTT
jgi:hypothetical protein